MEKRFHADPSVQATELLLQERIPVGVPAAHPRAEEVLTGRVVQTLPGMSHARLQHAEPRNTSHPAAFKRHLQRHGHDRGRRLFQVRSKCRDSLARRCDPRQLGRVYLPARRAQRLLFGPPDISRYSKRPQSYEVAFSEDKADFWRTDAGIVTHMEVVVSAEDNAEVRRVSLTNNSRARAKLS